MPLRKMPPVDAEEARQSEDARFVYEMIAGQWVSSTVRAAAELDVFGALADGSRSGDDIAAAASSDARTMRRLLVACTSLGLLTEDATGRFALTTRGGLLADGAPGSLRALARLQGAPGVWRLWGALPEAVRRGESQAQVLFGEDYFSFLASHPEERGVFASAMRDLTNLIVEEARRIVDFGSAQEILDVGGGNGSFLLRLLGNAPDARGSILERPEVADLARQAAAQAGLASRFDAVAGDFFEAVPPADYYILKLILHDWDDDRCRRILANCRRSARAGSRLLIVEALIGEAVAGGDGLDLGAMMDMTILTLVPGQERRLSEYDALLDSSGWRREVIVSTRSMYSLVEAVPV